MPQDNMPLRLHAPGDNMPRETTCLCAIYFEVEIELWVVGVPSQGGVDSQVLGAVVNAFG